MKIGGRHLQTSIQYLFLEAVAEVTSEFGIYIARLIILSKSSRCQKKCGGISGKLPLGPIVRSQPFAY